MSFVAKYEGECKACEEVITPGQVIASASEGGYLHVVCPDVVEASPRPQCSMCFQEKAANGACGCDA